RSARPFGRSDVEPVECVHDGSESTLMVQEKNDNFTVAWRFTAVKRVDRMYRTGAVLFVVLMMFAAPQGAWAEQAPTAPSSLVSYPQFFTSVDGYWQGGTFNTGSNTTAHASSARAFDASVGVRFNDYLLVALRGQEAVTNVNLTLAPQTIMVHSHSFGLRTL